MGKYFKALEQAERERMLREDALQRARSDETVVSTPAAESAAVAPPPPVQGPPIQAPSIPVPQVEAPPTPPASMFQRPAAPRRVTPAATRTAWDHDEQPPSSPAKVDEHLVSLLTPTSFGAERYRALRHRVEELHKTAGLSVVAVTSPESGDGKTVTAINLAGALAQSTETRVLIVDVDLRRSSLTEYLGLDESNTKGLVDAILDSRVSLKDVVESCPPFNLSILPAGKQPSSPYELLKSPRLTQLLEEARQQYDYVVLDTPPLVPLPDCSVIGRSVDGFLVVVAAHKTNRKLVNEAVAALPPASILGLVFNADDAPHATYYTYGGRSSRRRGARNEAP